MTNAKIARSAIGALALLLLTLSCGQGSSSGGDNGNGSTSDWSISGTASDPNPTIQQAAADTIVITVTRAGGYTGAVTLTPIFAGGGGITATIDNIVTAANVTTARLIVAVGGSFPAGPQSVNVAVQPVAGVAPITVVVTVNVVTKPGVFVVVANALSIGQGSQATIPVTIHRTNFTDPVPMSLATTQPGLSATFAPNPVTDTTAFMTLQVDATVPVGTYSVGVRANEGITGFQGTAPLTLTVTPPGSIVLSIGLNPLLVVQGGATPTGITIGRTNFSGPVTLTFTGLPAGLTAATMPNPTSANTASITFGALGSVPTGSYLITITATGLGIPNATIVQTVTVTP